MALVAARGSATNRTRRWLTLTGDAPKVIAKGGFSGLFPDSSSAAYGFAVTSSVHDVILWCDLQLTKDDSGICFPYLNMENSSTIASIFQNRSNSYSVNGVPTNGYFSLDFTLDELSNVLLTQGIFSRTPNFDGNWIILTVQDVVKSVKPPGLWLNIQHDAFFQQRNLSMRSYVVAVSKTVSVSYISSPEVSFLTSIVSRFKASKTKLVFRLLEQVDVEPTTNQTYGAILRNLTYIKTFASGILVPKSYIWPVKDQYLQPHSSLVLDAHNQGLEIYASDFANDASIAYNYSYDPVSEYLSFIDNGVFSVDGVLTDFPITPSEARECFAHIGKNHSGQAKPLVISNCGASGDYPGCTDLAYKKAIVDGADVVDCPVQMTKDGVPICLSSINLIDSTNVAMSPFSNLATYIPELKGTGIYTFTLTWSQIQSLKPTISNPYFTDFNLVRNPLYKNAGNFVQLSEFLTQVKNATSVSGVLIGIEYAAFLAKQGLGIVDAVLEALSKAGYDNETVSAKKVMIQSTSSSVLVKLKEEREHYERVYVVDEKIRDALNSTIEDIKKFADSVVIDKRSVYPVDAAFLSGVTNVVPKLQSFNIPVYVQIFRNEFASQAWDFFSDPTVEINTYSIAANVDGIITDFPRTAASYKRNLCLGDNLPAYMSPVVPGTLLQVMSYLPPAEAPYPVLTESDVVEPPLPAVSAKEPSPGGSTSLGPTSPRNRQPKTTRCIFSSSLTLLLVVLLLLGN